MGVEQIVSSSAERPMMQQAQQENGVNLDDKLICEKCGKEAERLHMGCPLCEDCCDCRPAGT